jgi:hypothetical protein
MSYDTGVNIPFACVLSVASSTLLLAIVSIHRATEDPFLWRYPGNVIDVRVESKDVGLKLERIYVAHLTKQDHQKRSTTNGAG